MKTVRLRDEELRLLTDLLAQELEFGVVGSQAKVVQSVLAKLTKEQPITGANAGALERALLETAGGKAVATTAGGYGRVSAQAARVGATDADMRVVGVWLARQTWLREPLTILTVLNKWPDWYPKAKATAAPEGTAEGLSDTKDLRPTTGSGSRKTAAGRRPEGLR